MVKRIDPQILRQLREDRRLSQEELGNKAKVNKQTISRLERGTGTRTRDHTITELARALKVDAAVLTGEAPAPERQRDSEPARSQFNVRIHTGARNALFLIADRYFVRPWQVLELAPYLFCWAAEASLRKRREQLHQVEGARNYARSAEAAIPHLPLPDFTLTDEKIAAERESIEDRDLFAMAVENNQNLSRSPFPNDRGGGYDNPFARFLSDLGSEFDACMTFEEFPAIDSPLYKVCKEEAALLVDGDEKLADEILEGRIGLWDMPKEFYDDYLPRREWIRAKAEENHALLLALIANKGEGGSR